MSFVENQGELKKIGKEITALAGALAVRNVAMPCHVLDRTNFLIDQLPSLISAEPPIVAFTTQ